MRRSTLAALLALFLAGCGPTLHGYSLRHAAPDESRQIAEFLDPLLMALELPSLPTIARAKGCKIGFAIIRTDRVNVWSSPATASPCLYFTLFVTEGALKMPADQLMATIAHELGHVALHHTPQPDAPQLRASPEQWQGIQEQELAADRFAIALLKRTKSLYRVGACEAMAEFLRRSVPDWYGAGISARMHAAVTQRAEAADAACGSTEITALPRLTPTARVQ
jgi:uncharacterized protein DUF955